MREWGIGSSTETQIFIDPAKTNNKLWNEFLQVLNRIMQLELEKILTISKLNSFFLERRSNFV